jgi:hypothetical protein
MRLAGGVKAPGERRTLRVGERIERVPGGPGLLDGVRIVAAAERFDPLGDRETRRMDRLGV